MTGLLRSNQLNRHHTQNDEIDKHTQLKIKLSIRSPNAHGWMDKRVDKSTS